MVLFLKYRTAAILPIGPTFLMVIATQLQDIILQLIKTVARNTCVI